MICVEFSVYLDMIIPKYKKSIRQKSGKPSKQSCAEETSQRAVTSRRLNLLDLLRCVDVGGEPVMPEALSQY